MGLRVPDADTASAIVQGLEQSEQKLLLAALFQDMTPEDVREVFINEEVYAWIR